MASDMILFGSNKPNIYRYTDVYIYGVDDPSIAGNGKIVPAVNSIIVDDRFGPANIHIYVVTYVDNEGDVPTYKASMQDIKGTAPNNRIVNYGERLATVYFEEDYFLVPTTVASNYRGLVAPVDYPDDPVEGDWWRSTGPGTFGGDFDPGFVAGDVLLYTDSSWDRIIVGDTLDRFHVDRKYTLYSSEADYYIIYDASDTAISINMEGYPDERSVKIPMIEGTDGVWSFQDCAMDPDKNPGDGDYVTVKIYDASEVELTAVQMLCRQGMTDTNSVNVDFIDRIVVTAKIESDYEQDSEGRFVIPFNTVSVDASQFSIKVYYANGTTLTKTLANGMNPGGSGDAFVYGLDDIITSESGETFDFLVKLFLPNTVHSLLDESEGSERYISVIGTVIID